MDNKITNVDELIKDIDSKLDDLNQRELQGKTESEQQELKKMWEDQRKKIVFEQHEKVSEKEKKILDFINNHNNNLIPLEELKVAINEWKQQLDDEYEKVMEDVMNSLLQEKSEYSMDLYNKLIQINKEV